MGVGVKGYGLGEDAMANHSENSSTGSYTDRCSSDFTDEYITEMCSGSEEGSCLRRMHRLVYRSTLGLRVIKRKKRRLGARGYGSGGETVPAVLEDLGRFPEV